MSFKTLFVVNPRSAGGRTAKEWASLEKIARKHLPDCDVKHTNAMGHATELARAGLKAGAEMIVSVGGDGTNNEVINGFFENGKPIREKAVFACVPRGTGCDFARGLKIPKDAAKAFARLAGKDTAPLDVGRIDCVSADGKPVTRYFVNIAGFGASGDVVARVNRSGKKLGGFFTFLGASVASLMSFKNPSVTFSVDGAPEETATMNVMFVCNGSYCGGGMKAGPKAKTDDGMFDLTIVGDLTKADALASGRLLYAGTIHKHKKVRCLQAKKLTARAANGSTVLVEADGEQPGVLPATYTILPGALRLKI